MPNMPRLETAERAALILLGLELLLRGAPARSFTSLLISTSALGLGLADDRRDQAAVDRHGDADIGVLVRRIAVSVQETLTSGLRSSAIADAFMMKSLTDSL